MGVEWGGGGEVGGGKAPTGVVLCHFGCRARRLRRQWHLKVEDLGCIEREKNRMWHMGSIGFL